jgi:hypothetical protein
VKFGSGEVAEHAELLPISSQPRSVLFASIKRAENRLDVNASGWDRGRQGLWAIANI